jgi:hypothetical protein
VGAVGRQHRAGADVHGVRAGAGLGQSIGPDPFARGEPGQVALFLLYVPYQTSGSVAMPMCAPKAVEKLASTEM